MWGLEVLIVVGDRLYGGIVGRLRGRQCGWRGDSFAGTECGHSEKMMISESCR